jgi:KDO2-lipid IV(A) lauroyltransferase
MIPMSRLEPVSQNSRVPAASDQAAQDPRRRPGGRFLIRWAEYAVVRSLLSVVQMFSYSASQRLGSILGRMIFILCWKLRRQALSNLRLSYGSRLTREQAQRIARGAFDVLGRNIISVVTLQSRPYQGLSVENAGVLQDAYERGKGVVLVSAHMGCFSRLAALPQFLHMKGASIMKKQKNSVLLDWARGVLQRRFDLRVILKPDAARDVGPYLREGRLVGFFADQHPRKGGFDGFFFDQPVKIAPGPAICARRYKAPMVLLTLESTPDGKHHAHLDAIDSTGTLEQVSRRWMSKLEDRIRRHPEQWMWMHRRWRDLPAGS